MPVMIEEKKFYNVPEVAEILHVGAQTVRRYIKDGKMKGKRIGRPVLVAESHLMSFIEHGNQS